MNESDQADALEPTPRARGQRTEQQDASVRDVQFEYRVGTLGEHDEDPSYGYRKEEVFATLETAQDALEILRPEFADAWIERRPVNPLPWERL